MTHDPRNRDAPFDRRLRPGGVIDINRGMTSQTHQRFLEIAAALASDFGDNTHRHRFHSFYSVFGVVGRLWA